MCLDGCIPLGAATQKMSEMHVPWELLLLAPSRRNPSRLRCGFGGEGAGSADCVDCAVPLSVIMELRVWTGSSLMQDLNPTETSSFQPSAPPGSHCPHLCHVGHCCVLVYSEASTMLPTGLCVWLLSDTCCVNLGSDCQRAGLAWRRARSRSWDKLPILPVPRFPYRESRDSTEIFLRALCG